MRFTFNEKKRAAQAAAHVLQRHGGRFNYMHLIKELYLADRQSLIDRGVLITGDAMFAMRHGPVLSNILDAGYGRMVIGMAEDERRSTRLAKEDHREKPRTKKRCARKEHERLLVELLHETLPEDSLGPSSKPIDPTTTRRNRYSGEDRAGLGRLPPRWRSRRALGRLPRGVDPVLEVSRNVPRRDRALRILSSAADESRFLGW
ncbi:MAG: Panacea domain-containing protein [bacterium]